MKRKISILFGQQSISSATVSQVETTISETHLSSCQRYPHPPRHPSHLSPPRRSEFLTSGNGPFRPRIRLIPLLHFQVMFRGRRTPPRRPFSLNNDLLPKHPLPLHNNRLSLPHHKIPRTKSHLAMDRRQHCPEEMVRLLAYYRSGTFHGGSVFAEINGKQ